MTITIDQNRLAGITHLYKGNHKPPGDTGPVECCIMEAVAWITHKEWTDHPPCVCPVIGAFMRIWNDQLPDDERCDLLVPLIPQLINTRGSKALELKRAMMAFDWL